MHATLQDPSQRPFPPLPTITAEKDSVLAHSCIAIPRYSAHRRHCCVQHIVYGNLNAVSSPLVRLGVCIASTCRSEQVQRSSQE